MLSFSKSPSVLEIVLSFNYRLDVILVQDNVNIKGPGFLINQLSLKLFFNRYPLSEIDFLLDQEKF